MRLYHLGEVLSLSGGALKSGHAFAFTFVLIGVLGTYTSFSQLFCFAV